MSHVKAYSTKRSLQSLKVMMCLGQGGVSVGVYAVIQSLVHVTHAIKESQSQN